MIKLLRITYRKFIEFLQSGEKIMIGYGCMKYILGIRKDEVLKANGNIVYNM